MLKNLSSIRNIFVTIGLDGKKYCNIIFWEKAIQDEGTTNIIYEGTLEEFIQEYYKTRKPPEDWILKIATGHKISKSMTGKKRKLKKGIKKNENTVS